MLIVEECTSFMVYILFLCSTKFDKYPVHTTFRDKFFILYNSPSLFVSLFTLLQIRWFPSILQLVTKEISHRFRWLTSVLFPIISNLYCLTNFKIRVPPFPSTFIKYIPSAQSMTFICIMSEVCFDANII